MNSQNPRDIKRRLKELEEQLNPSSEPSLNSGSLQGLVTQLRNWYQTLPNAGKLVVAGGGVLIAFSFLNLFLRLVTAGISLVVLGGLLYLGYKFLIESGPSQN